MYEMEVVPKAKTEAWQAPLKTNRFKSGVRPNYF